MPADKGLIAPVRITGLPSNRTTWTTGKIIVKPDGHDLMIEINYSNAPSSYTLVEFPASLVLLDELKSTLQELKRRRKNVDRSG